MCAKQYSVIHCTNWWALCNSTGGANYGPLLYSSIGELYFVNILKTPYSIFEIWKTHMIEGDSPSYLCTFADFSYLSKQFQWFQQFCIHSKNGIIRGVPWLNYILLSVIAELMIDCGARIAERVSALDWLSLRYAAIITLPVSNPGLCF